MICSILAILYVSKREVATVNQILPHIIQLLNFCYKKRPPLLNQKISFLQQQSLENYNACMIDYIEDDNSRKSQSCSPSTCSFSENASKEKSDFEIVVEGRPLHVDRIQISPKDLHKYIKLSLLGI